MAASAPGAGGTVVGKTAKECMRSDYRVVCGIQVENWTHFTLMDPRVRLAAGALEIPPTSVLPAHREVVVARKTWGSVYGSCGTLSWLIESLNRRVFVMWHAPFNFDFSKNILAVGLSKTGCTDHTLGKSVYNTMLTAESSGNITFKRQEFGKEFDTVTVREGGIEVEGTMGSSHKAEVKIIVRPTEHQGHAPALKDLFGKAAVTPNLVDISDQPLSSDWGNPFQEGKGSANQE